MRYDTLNRWTGKYMTRPLTVIRTFRIADWLCLASLMVAVCTLPFWVVVLGAIQ